MQHWPVVLGLVVAGMCVIAVVYLIAGKPIIQRRRRITDIKHGLRKNGYKLYQEFQYDQDKKTIVLHYLKLDNTFFFDECDLGWFIYDRIPATKEWVIVAETVFNDTVAALVGATNKYYEDMGYKLDLAQEDIPAEKKHRFHLPWRQEHAEGSSA